MFLFLFVSNMCVCVCVFIIFIKLLLLYDGINFVFEDVVTECLCSFQILSKYLGANRQQEVVISSSYEPRVAQCPKNGLFCQRMLCIEIQLRYYIPKNPDLSLE